MKVVNCRSGSICIEFATGSCPPSSQARSHSRRWKGKRQSCFEALIIIVADSDCARNRSCYRRKVTADSWCTTHCQPSYTSFAPHEFSPLTANDWHVSLRLHLAGNELTASPATHPCYCTRHHLSLPAAISSCKCSVQND